MTYTPEDSVPEEFQEWINNCPVMWHRTGATLIEPYTYDSLTYTFSFDVSEEQETNNE